MEILSVIAYYDFCPWFEKEMMISKLDNRAEERAGPSDGLAFKVYRELVSS